MATTAIRLASPLAGRDRGGCGGRGTAIDGEFKQSM